MSLDTKPGAWHRAIAYMAWGTRYLDLAMKSVASAAFMDMPFVLLTDRATADSLPENHPFAAVKVFETSETDQILKARMWEFLPEDYDSFLFLDVDTRVLKDIGFGFEMAERHGIAAAAASNYCLDQFWGFGEVMTAAGVAHRGQNQFNSGVIFFTRRPDVEEVFRLWPRLASELTERTGWKRVDQPFFTLSIEMLGFNPYTLSPNYNYRTLAAEPISGDVRIWHSFHEPPDDINDFHAPWPRKRYIGTPRASLREVSPSDIQEIGHIIAGPAIIDS